MSRPSIRPETTIDKAVARLFGCASVPTSGNIICYNMSAAFLRFPSSFFYLLAFGENKHTGVTVVTLIRNEITTKASKLFVKHKPNVIVDVKIMSHNTMPRRLIRSPRGHINNKPAAYPPWAHVGIILARSWVTLKFLASTSRIGCE